MKNILYLIAVLLGLIACEKPKEVIEEKYPDGNPKMIKYYSSKGDLVKEIGFYSNKQKQIEGEYKNNKRNGKWKYWYENGQLWSEGYFVDDVSDDVRITYFSNGKKQYEGKYDKGTKVGLWKFWDETGVLVKEVDFSKKENQKK